MRGMHPTPKTAVGMQVTFAERQQLQDLAAERRVTLSTLLRTAIAETFPAVKLEPRQREPKATT